MARLVNSKEIATVTFEPVKEGSVLYMGDEHFAPVHGKGNIALKFSSGKTITLFNVLYGTKLRKNLVSGPVLNKCGCKQVYESDKYILSKCGVFVGFGYYNNESRDAIFDDNHFSLIPRLKDIIPNVQESQMDDHTDDVPNEIHEPRKVARITTIRLLLALAVVHNLVIYQMIAKTTFLNGDLDEKVYMKQPEGFVMPGNEHKVCKLVKSITDQNQVDKAKKFLSSRFSMKDMGEADVILGIKIKRENKGIVITLSHYIEKILKKFNHEDCSSVSTPMDLVEKLKPNTGKPVDQLEYSRATGCL
nr:hypothetical protein [Tanacetum cinerariifolium]